MRKAPSMRPERKTILVCDDESGIVRDWKDRLKRVKSLKQSFDVKAITKEEFVEAISQLEKRREVARNSPPTIPSELKFGNHRFDSVSILVIDYDLFTMETSGSITGETVAYLSRCYSRCGLIVGVNQFGDNPFDLTLKGHPESFADLNIGDKQLDKNGLWTEPWKGFRPWHWPLLPLALEAFEHRVDQLLKGGLKRPVLSFLGLDTIAATLPRSVSEFLQGKSQRAPQKITFEQFVTESGNGLQRKDKVLDKGCTARIAAARVAKWLERLVLPGQDILIDAPHLVSRFPSLLQGKANPAKSWNATATFKSAREAGIDSRRIAPLEFQKEHWLSRPTWFWQEVSNCESIREVSNPWSSKGSDWVFCEDISAFLRRKEAKEFIAELPSPFALRYVTNPNSDRIKRLNLAAELRGVAYMPSIRFALR